MNSAPGSKTRELSSPTLELLRLLYAHDVAQDPKIIAAAAREVERSESVAAVSSELAAFALEIIDRWRVVRAHFYDESDVHAAMGADSVDASMLGGRGARSSHSIHEATNGDRCYVMATRDMVHVYRVPGCLELATECARVFAAVETWDVSALRIATAVDDEDVVTIGKRHRSHLAAP